MSREAAIEKANNDQALEEMWAKKAILYVSIYDELLHRKDLSTLKLTSIDDEIYKEFREQFPDLDVANFDYEASKTTEGKEKWRKFITAYSEERLKDFSMGTLMRVNGLEEFSQENSCVVVRVQFFAVEIARTREGVNAKYQAMIKASDSQ